MIDIRECYRKLRSGLLYRLAPGAFFIVMPADTTGSGPKHNRLTAKSHIVDRL